MTTFEKTIFFNQVPTIFFHMSAFMLGHLANFWLMTENVSDLIFNILPTFFFYFYGKIMINKSIFFRKSRKTACKGLKRKEEKYTSPQVIKTHSYDPLSSLYIKKKMYFLDTFTKINFVWQRGTPSANSFH